MRKKYYPLMIFVHIILISFLEAGAQNNKNNSGDEKPKRNFYLSFEDELVEGGAETPELFYLLQKKNFNYKKLIRLRENFLPEMRETAEVVKKSGSR